jgi:Dyp-type peroxidase family
MPSRRKDAKAVTQKVGKVLENLWKSEGEVARQERFSAAGTDYGPMFAAAATGPIESVAMTAEAAQPAEGAPTPAVGVEPVFEEAVRKDVQGNIIPGFNKDYQHFLFYRIGNVKAAKKWLQWIAPMISSMDEVLAFNRMYRAMRFRLGAKDVPIKATWANIAFSCSAIAALTSKDDCLKFGDESFRQGLAARSEYLGDPTDPKAIGNKRKWVVGGPKNEADILVLVAGDDPRLLRDMVSLIKGKASEYKLKLLFEQPGETLPGALRGHEHFGFKDGISQPGVRGRVSAVSDDYITPRYIQSTDPRSSLFAKPGQLLVWPGQFLLGMQRQNPENLFTPATEAANFPAWARNGSYLVCRRLQQDVKAFWEFAITTAASLRVPSQRFASMLVGRWPSGAPVMRTPSSDVPALGADDLANNHFLFDDDTRPSSLIPIPGYGGDTNAQARADMLGTVCPHFAHVRKVNPRDSSTDLGKVADSLIRMIMRRGIPFGPPVAGVKNPTTSLWKKERGLVFICYQSSIEDQFEFLTRRWANSQVQPNFGGHDPIIGQEGSQGSRTRFIDFPKGGKSVRIPLKVEWVIPTGGGYFFAPPISAIKGVLGS